MEKTPSQVGKALMCSQCGAPLSNRHQCDYCKTMFDAVLNSINNQFFQHALYYSSAAIYPYMSTASGFGSSTHPIIRNL